MITIIDYGMGNLKSVYNALKKVNFDCQISSEVTDIEMADKLILPGFWFFSIFPLSFRLSVFKL